MTFSEFLKVLGNRKQTLVFFLALFLIVGAGLSLLQPFQYAAKAKLLVVQESAATWVDPYQLQKSNEYVSDVLAKVVNTNSFLVEVLNANTAINKNLFSNDAEKQLDEWNKTVKASAANGKGVLNLTVYQTDRGQADQIVRGIIQILKANHTQYHGLGEKVQIKVIDQPFVTLKPAKPNIPVNIALSLVFGFIFALTYIYLFPGEKSAISLWPFSRKAVESQPQPYYFPNGQMAYHPGYQQPMTQAQSYREAPVQPVRQPIAQPPIRHEVAYAQPANLPLEQDDLNGVRLSAYNAAMDEGLSYEDVVKQGRMDNLRK